MKAKELGIDVPYRYRHLFEHLLDFIKANKDSIGRVNKKVAYQANCANRWLPAQDAWLNEILHLIGVERVQRRYEGRNALCCSGPLIRTDKEKALRMQEDNVKDAIDSGADALLTICPICDRVMRRPASNHGLPKIFITDFCRAALGEIAWPG